ncbi:MAG: exosortase/archaeosortase family protein [Chitinophagaceae bacterium]|nr:MAG: exosortase/archaeosortase family protein [Chitinophagaceae bacterium]
MRKHQKEQILYLAKFLGLFCLLFYGTEAVIAFSSPGNHYSPFVADHLNFVDPFRFFLLESTRSLLSVWEIQTVFKDDFTVGIPGGRSVKMVYSCLGYGVLSFWIAFVFANRASWQKKAGWMVGGCLLLCAINIVRIALLLLAINRGWSIPFGWDHHTWFNIVAYAMIIGMIVGFGATGKKNRSLPADRRNSRNKKASIQEKTSTEAGLF